MDMEKFVDSQIHLNEEEKREVKEIRNLMRALMLECVGKDVVIILNALDFLKEFYLKVIKTQ